MILWIWPLGVTGGLVRRSASTVLGGENTEGGIVSGLEEDEGMRRDKPLKILMVKAGLRLSACDGLRLRSIKAVFRLTPGDTLKGKADSTY